MRALRFHGNKDIRIDDVPDPVLKSGWVKIKNAWCGICGSDLHEYTIGPFNTPTKPHVITGECLPTICGHEFSGIVVETGPDVTDITVGQKVVVFPIVSDNTCHWCQVESYGMCPNWGFIGYSGIGGGMAEYICVDQRACHKVPEHVPLDVAALVEPLAVGWHAVKEAQVKPGQHCLVIGAGPIGLAVVNCLIAFGITSIMVSEPSTVRLAQAKEAGATRTIDPLEEDVVSICSQISDGLGPHAVFECAGIQAAFTTALQVVRGRGVIMNVAVYETKLIIDQPILISRRQITIRGSNTYTRQEFDEVIEAIATKRFKAPELMITARVPLEKAIDGGFLELLNSKDKHVKILVGVGD